MFLSRYVICLFITLQCIGSPWIAARQGTLADAIMQSNASKTLRLINKCFWMSGAEDFYKTSFKESVRLSSKQYVNVERSYQTIPIKPG